MKIKPQKRFSAAAARRSTTLKAKLVRIGNSRGVRLPKTIIEQAGFTTEVEIAVKDNQVIISSASESAPRVGWEDQIKKVLLENGEDVDEEWLCSPSPGGFGEKEWTW